MLHAHPNVSTDLLHLRRWNGGCRFLTQLVGTAAGRRASITSPTCLSHRACGVQGRPRPVVAGARRSRSDIDPQEAPSQPPHDDSAASTSGRATSSSSSSAASGVAESHEDQKPRHAAPRKRQFGPEPPPAQSAASTSSVTGQQAAGTSESATAAPKRRGRPPKAKGDPPAAQQAEAPASKPSTTSQSAGRKPFGPAPPPPPSPSPAAAAADPSSPANPILPSDPNQLTPEDILDLPLPDDPRVGPFPREDLLRQAEAVLAEAFERENFDEGEGEDEELDYDRLIAMANKVDSAAYIMRAFERAELGLDPTPDPLADPTQLEAEEAQARAGVNPQQPGVVDAALEEPGSPGSQAADGASSTSTSVDPAGPTSPSSSVGGAAGRPAATAPPPLVEPQRVLSPEEEAAGERRVALLVDLLQASGAELESKIEAVAPEVDELMIQLLEWRYATAMRMGQGEQSCERISVLLRALRYIYQRRTSSAAERLLDDVLEILADEDEQPHPERRRRDAAARLRNAFTGGMLDVDVFTAAAALAERRQAAADALAGEQVSLEEFKGVTLGLLTHAKKVQLRTKEDLEAVDKEVERLEREDPRVLRELGWRERLQQVRLARQALADREGAIAALEEVVMLTRAIEVQLLTGR